MVCPNTRLEGNRTDGRQWENYSQSVEYRVSSYFTPNNLGDLVLILMQAFNQSRYVKAVGSGWSFEDIATSRDWVIDAARLNRKLDYVTSTPDLLHPFRLGQPTTGQVGLQGAGLIHVEAGITLLDLNRLLDGLKLAMPTLGGSQGQTLAGAFSTSTHGSHFKLPPFPDLVAAVHLVTVGGQEVWIESKSHPVTVSDEALRTVLPCSDTIIIRDDDALNAVRVGVGRFGVIYSVILNVTNEHEFTEWTNMVPIDVVIAKLEEGVGSSQPLAPLIAMLDTDHAPNWASRRTSDLVFLDINMSPRKSGHCWIRRRWAREGTAAAPVPPEDPTLPDLTSITSSTDLPKLIIGAVAASLSGTAAWVVSPTNPANFIPFAIIGSMVISGKINGIAASLVAKGFSPNITLGRAVAESINAIMEAETFGGEFRWIIDDINSLLLGTMIAPTSGPEDGSGKIGRSWQISSGKDGSSGAPFYRVNSAEYVFGTQDRRFLDFIQFVRNQGSNFVQAGYASIRFTLPSKALLSMHNLQGPMAVSIEVVSLQGLRDNAKWLSRLEARALQLRGRPHWGQQNTMTDGDTIMLYLPTISEWRDQLRRICGLDLVFSNEYTRDRGLEPTDIWREITHVRRENGAITHLVNPNTYWSPMPKQKAIYETAAGLVRYFIRDGDNRQQLMLRQVLKTPNDDVSYNNLTNLPDMDIVFDRPPDALIERHVTAVRRSNGRWRAILNLHNHLDRWSVSQREAFSQVKNGTHRYFVQDPAGHRTWLEASEYFTTLADGQPDNNLNSLPSAP